MPTPHAARLRGAGWRARPGALSAPVLLIVALIVALAATGGVVDARDADSAPVEADAGDAPAIGRRPESSSGRSGASSSDEKRRAKEALVKAALLFKFLKYAEFPVDAFEDEGKKKAPIVLLVVGDDPMGTILDKTFDGKKLHGREVVIKRAKSRPKDLDAHLVYTSGLDAKEEKKLIEASRKKPCILVGEDPGFAERGGFINLYKEKNKPRFEVNASRQEDTGIELSANLLRFAKIVEEKERDDEGSRDDGSIQPADAPGVEVDR